MKYVTTLGLFVVLSSCSKPMSPESEESTGICSQLLEEVESIEKKTEYARMNLIYDTVKARDEAERLTGSRSSPESGASLEKYSDDVKTLTERFDRQQMLVALYLKGHTCNFPVRVPNFQDFSNAGIECSHEKSRNEENGDAPYVGKAKELCNIDNWKRNETEQ